MDLLIEVSKQTIEKELEIPSGASYDELEGYWVQNGNPMVSVDSPYGKLGSKKCDVETGEDQKGE